VYVCMHLCMYICMYVCSLIAIHRSFNLIHACVHAYIHAGDLHAYWRGRLEIASAGACLHAFMTVCMHKSCTPCFVRISRRAEKDACSACMWAYAHACSMHACINIPKFTHTHTHISVPGHQGSMCHACTTVRGLSRPGIHSREDT
jgi:hypothetical protein